MSLIGCSKSSNECVKTSPGLSEWTGAQCWWFRVAKELTSLVVDLRLAKLVKVTKEFKDMGAVTPGK